MIGNIVFGPAQDGQPVHQVMSRMGSAQDVTKIMWERIEALERRVAELERLQSQSNSSPSEQS